MNTRKNYFVLLLFFSLKFCFSDVSYDQIVGGIQKWVSACNEELPVYHSLQFETANKKNIKVLESRANEGDLIAIRSLIEFYMYDDPDERGEISQKWIEKGCKVNEPYALNCKAEKFYEIKDYTNYIEYLTKSAALGYAISQYNVAVYFYNGELAEKDLSKAIYYWFLAAKQGYLDAIVQLGALFCEQGNYELACDIFKIAEKMGSCLAKGYLGFMLSQGLGMEVDYQKGYETLKESIIEGGTWICQRVYVTNALCICLQGGCVFNPEDLLRLFQICLEAGDTCVITEAIYLLTNKKTNDENLKIWLFNAAKEWAEKEDDGPGNLATCYRYGFGCDIDLQQAFKWMFLAAQKNNTAAISNLGVMYVKGEGCDVDLKQAFKWISLAAQKNDTAAIYNLGCMYMLGEGCNRDLLKAIECFEKIEDCYENAVYKLHKCYRGSNLFTKDLKLCYKHRKLFEGYDIFKISWFWILNLCLPIALVVFLMLTWKEVHKKQDENAVQAAEQYYLKAFKSIDLGKSPKFNLFAFFFGHLWLLYRKMYGMAFVWLVVCCMVGFVAAFMDVLLVKRGNFCLYCSTIALMFFLGKSGNKIYYNYVKKLIKKGYHSKNYIATDSGIVLLLPIIEGIYNSKGVNITLYPCTFAYFCALILIALIWWLGQFFLTIKKQKEIQLLSDPSTEINEKNIIAIIRKR